jgi:hypothetical protein
MCLIVATSSLQFYKNLGSDIHVMLALRCSSRQIVMAYEELYGTDMVGQLLGKR